MITMDNENKNEITEPKGYETGQSFVKKIGAFGMAAFLLIFIGYLIVTFFSGRSTALDGYTPPQTGEYYAEHPDELAEEIKTNVAPLLDGIEDAYAEDGKVVVEIGDEEYFTVRTALLKKFDENLLELRKETGETT